MRQNRSQSSRPEYSEGSRGAVPLAVEIWVGGEDRLHFVVLSCIFHVKIKG